MQMTTSAGASQCAAAAQRIKITGGTLSLTPADWEAEGLTAPRHITVRSFSIDSVEYTWERYAQCVATSRCNAVQLHVPAPAPEPGLPITEIDPQHAAALCHLDGGRLPNGDEWMVAAAGLGGRRFPWGSTGLVCRRAVFGLPSGPCAQGATGPDLVASRPDGATSEGVQDLAGNVAEWTVEPQGIVARGGSYRSTVAGQLKIWASETAVSPQPHIGFRCVYDDN
jgi:formylglycine-generating enzyme required for sulfatase activity